MRMRQRLSVPSSFLQPLGRGARVSASTRLRIRPATGRSSACSSLRAERTKTTVYSRTAPRLGRALQQALDLCQRFAGLPATRVHQIRVVQVLPKRPVLSQVNEHSASLAAVIYEKFHTRHFDGVLRIHRHLLYTAASLASNAPHERRGHPCMSLVLYG